MEQKVLYYINMNKMIFFGLGVLQYYVHHNKDVLNYAPLKKELCQCLRELGNVLVFCMELELALAQEEMMDLLSAAAFTSVIPKPSAKSFYIFKKKNFFKLCFRFGRTRHENEALRK